MIKLADLKDENGTSIQSHAEVFLEKVNSAGLSCALLLAYPPENLVLLSNLPTESVADVLSQIASQIRKEPSVHAPLDIVSNPTKIN
jgi:hypothetical protein